MIFHAKCQRKITKNRWSQRVSNEEQVFYVRIVKTVDGGWCGGGGLAMSAKFQTQEYHTTGHRKYEMKYSKRL